MRITLIAVTAAVALFSCKSQPDQAAIEEAKKMTIDSINNVNLAKQQVIDSMNQVGKKRGKGASESGYSPAEYTAPADGTTAAAAPAETKKKKGFSSWSHTAKGAVVGAGAGAVTGAVVNKNDRVKGAALGTLIGAGVGAGTGAIVDHAKKKKEQQ
ncbi:glycine zipper domain-containing protein [Chitinophaga sp. sic0106]|uniref:glycine zipper domain-containing protein n=1 Tax=Chitinophaga sp. sic0106 TaxID=2854785 RepID=UPI001C473D6A|nr:glycine zipper domain-containing protein [Chitinophaga sp. sic0106]MBV7529701.1 glycine zipper 2TM domain-containing protein [Chitinophaga sp. sic0106]